MEKSQMKTQKKRLLANGLLAIGLFAGAAHAQNIVYDFTLYLAGLGAGGPWQGSFDYFSGTITNFTFQGEQWQTLSQGDTLSFQDAAGSILTTSLYTPLGGQSASAHDFVYNFPGGGYMGWCGSAQCDQPVTFTAEKAVSAPELDSGSMASALTLLFGGLAVLRGRREKIAA